MTLSRPLLGGVLDEVPYFGHVDFDVFIDQVQLVESVDDLQGLVNSLDVESEVICLVDGAGLKPLDNAYLAATGA